MGIKRSLVKRMRQQSEQAEEGPSMMGILRNKLAGNSFFITDTFTRDASVSKVSRRSKEDSSSKNLGYTINSSRLSTFPSDINKPTLSHNSPRTDRPSKDSSYPMISTSYFLRKDATPSEKDNKEIDDLPSFRVKSVKKRNTEIMPCNSVETIDKQRVK
eukprot:TRINITY_DN20040_c0_g1_i1.p2 TRINITY_DN20040_c0_g1~~TRINITY_DN20040_c0_g1_i1.p2  ORF type:complete len:159 (-),score=18.37 TRINITY_DN20040_c0_g1_i1:226-702(-)